MLQMREFRRPITTYSVGEVLKSLPRDLDETYDRILHRFTDKQRAIAVCAMRWIVFSQVTMTRATLSVAILIDMEYTSRRLKTDDPTEIEDYLNQPFDEKMIFDASEVVDLLAGLVEEKAKAEINKQKVKVEINKMTDSDSTNGWPQFDERAQVGKDKWEKGDDKSLALISGLPRIKRSVMVHIPGMPMSDELAVLFNYPGEPKSPLCDMESTDPVIVAAHFSSVEFLTSERLRSRTEPIRDFALDQGRANFHFAASCLRYLAFVAKVYELEGLVVDSVPD